MAVPYYEISKSDKVFQDLIALIFILIDEYTDVVVLSSESRIGVALMTKQKLYLLEIKMDKSEKALKNQIDLNEFAPHFSQSELPTVSAKANFAPETRLVSNYKGTLSLLK